MAGKADLPDLSGTPSRVARALLGASLRHAGVTVRLTELEAYAGPEDPASHAHRGPTPRTAIMFGPPGRLYVYFVYGQHWCANIVIGPEGRASAVLLRGGEVHTGIELARTRRPGVPDVRLARGPAGLARALALTGADTGSVAELSPAARSPAPTVCSGPRVGVRNGADRPWRFWLAGEPSVSAYRAATFRPHAGGSRS